METTNNAEYDERVTQNRNNSFTDIFDESFSPSSPPMSLSEPPGPPTRQSPSPAVARPTKYTGQYGNFRSVQEIDLKYRDVFSYPYFNLIQSRIIDDALYTDKSIVVCAPTGSGKTVIFEMAIVQLLMELDDGNYTGDFKIIYMAPVKALCTERLSEWYPKFTRLGHLCIEVTGDTDVDFAQLASYKIIITTPEKWDMLTRRWREFRTMVEVIKLFLIDEVHILHDDVRGPVLEAVVSRMKTIEASMQAEHRIEQAHLKIQNAGESGCHGNTARAPRIRFVAVSATVSNPEDVATWIGTPDYPAVYYKMGEECRPVKLQRVVEGYHCPEGANAFKFDLMLSYKLWPIIEKYYNGKPTLIFCNTRKSVTMTAQILAREVTINFSQEQRVKLASVASTICDKKLQALVMSGVGIHHAGLLMEERLTIEQAFRMRDLPLLVTTTTLAMGVNLPAHLVIIKCTQQYINGQYQEYSVSTVLQMMGRAGRPQFDTEATAVIMTRSQDKSRYASLVDGSGPLESALHLRLAEHLNSEVALGTVQDIAQGVQWARSTFLHVRAARDPRRYLNLPSNPPPPPQLISQRIQDLCVTAMNGLASAGLITMDEASCVTATPAGRLMSLYCLDFDTMKLIMKISGDESLQQLLWLVCQSHELAGLQLRTDERRTLNTLNRNTAAPATTIRYPVKGKISTKQTKFYCIIQAIFGCLHIPDPSLHQEAMKLLRTADRICKCMVAYITRDEFIKECPPFLEAVVNSITLAKCCTAQLWPDSPYVSRQLRGIGPALSTALASAGKTTFMLIEESHPRDLERIMNKGAPAGNVLRKQVSMLPKYQLTAEQKNFETVLVTLTLLNASHMQDNISQLTAGENHKSYIIVGDSENCVLLCASFKDKDLMKSTNGTILYSVKRRTPFRHSIHIFCISSSFVDLDVKTSITMNGYERPPDVDTAHPTNVTAYTNSSLDTQNTNKIKPTKKQTTITDTFKERKRRSNANESAKEITPKSKKDCKSIENFKSIRDACYGLQTMPKLVHTPGATNVRQRQSEEAHKTPNCNKTEHLTLYNSTQSASPVTEELIENLHTNKFEKLVNNTTEVETTIHDDIPNTQDFTIESLLEDIEKEMESTKKGKNNNTKNTNRPKHMKTLNPLPIVTNVHTTCDGSPKNSQFCNKYISAQDENTEELTLNTSNTRKILDNSSGLVKNVHRSYSKYRDLVYNEGTSSDEGEVSKQNGFTDKIMPNLCNYLQNASSKIKSLDENSINLPNELMQNSYENANYECDNTISKTIISETPKQSKSYKGNEENFLTVSKPQNVKTEFTGITEVLKNSDKYPAKLSEQFLNPTVLSCTGDDPVFEKQNQGYPLHTYLAPIKTQFNDSASTMKSTEKVNIITGFLKERTEVNPRITLKKSSNLKSTDELLTRLCTSKTQRMLTPKSDEGKRFKFINPHTKCNLLPVMSLKNSVTREDGRNGTYSNADATIHDSISQQTVEITEKLKVELQIKSTYNESGVDVQKTGFMKCEKYSKILGKSNNGPLKRKFDKAFAQPQELIAIPSQVEDNKRVTSLNYDNASQAVATRHISENIEQINIKNKNTSSMRSEQCNALQTLPKVNFEKFLTNNSSGIHKNIYVNVEPQFAKSDKLAQPMVKSMAMVLNNKDENNYAKFQKDTQKTLFSLDSEKTTLQTCNTIPMQPKVLQVESDSSPKSVTSILQKYCCILRKPGNTDDPKDVSYVETLRKESNQNEKAKQRPFKIQEINKINVDISPIIDFEEMERADETLTLLNSYNGKPTEELQVSEYNDVDSFTVMDNFSYSPDIDLVSSQNDEIDQNLHKKEFNLDHSLFDPKCLLASCETVMENVIPPPPSFRNNQEPQNTEQSVETWTFSTNVQESTDWISSGTPFFTARDSTRTEPFTNKKLMLQSFKYTSKEKFKPRRFSTPYRNLWGTVKK